VSGHRHGRPGTRFFRERRQSQAVIDVSQDPVERDPVRVETTSGFEQLLRARQAPRLQQAIQQDLLEQVALGVAPADLRQAAERRLQEAERALRIAAPAWASIP